MKIKSLFSVRKWLELFLGSSLAKNMSDTKYVKLKYYSYMGKKLNLKDPKTFNEKLQWLKLYDRNPEYTKMVDKYLVKEYISSTIGEEYIIPTLGIYDEFKDINFDNLPSEFIIKCTHDSGNVVICRDKAKLDIDSARAKMNKALRRNYYKVHREWPYKNVNPLIIVEKLMKDDIEEELVDYKFMCFNGKVKCSFICSDRGNEDLKIDFYDLDWNKLPFGRKKHPNSKRSFERPKNYELMIKLAEKLANKIPFVRVDFYEINGKVYFGELTFYPASGLEEFKPEEYDKILGDMIVLPKEKREEK